MEFTHQFTVPTDVDTAFDTLTDLERVAPCLPGARLEEVEGETYRGRVKVKVGPIQVTYAGTAEVVEKDGDAKRARISASGRETRGTGTARADVTATLSPSQDGETAVTVITSLAVTGKPAQFGRGVMEDVGNRIIETFAERLSGLLQPGVAEGEPAAAQASATRGRAPSDETGPRRALHDWPQEDDALNLLGLVGPSAAKRLAPVVAVLALLLGAWWWRRRE